MGIARKQWLPRLGSDTLLQERHGTALLPPGTPQGLLCVGLMSAAELERCTEPERDQTCRLQPSQVPVSLKK